MLGEIRQSHRDKYIVGFPLYEVSSRGVTFIDTENRKVIARGWEENGELVFSGDSFSLER